MCGNNYMRHSYPDVDCRVFVPLVLFVSLRQQFVKLRRNYGCLEISVILQSYVRGTMLT